MITELVPTLAQGVVCSTPLHGEWRRYTRTTVKDGQTYIESWYGRTVAEKRLHQLCSTRIGLPIAQPWEPPRG